MDEREMNRRNLWGDKSFCGGLVVALAVALLAGGCGGDRTGGSSGREVRDGGQTSRERLSDSVRFIETPVAQWEQPARLRLVREVRGAAISAATGESSLAPTFGDIRDVAPGRNGRILVLEGREARVTVVGRNGDVVRRLGGRGAGPGELSTPDRVEAAPHGELLVLERRPAAIHRWRDGEYAGATTLTPSSLSAETSGGPSDVTGLADWGPALAGGRAVRLIRLDLSDPSASASAVYVADSAGRIDAPALAWSTPGTRSGLPEVFGSRPSWTAGDGPHGPPWFAVARGDRYEIRLHDVSGALRTVIRRDVEPPPVTDELRERALDGFVEEAGRAGAPPGMAAELRDQLPVSERLPVIGDLWQSTPDGRLWVGLVGPGSPSEPASVIREYDVYGPGGRYMGPVPSPAGFELHRVRDRLLYGSWKDSLGVPGVRIYRLVEPQDPSDISSAPGPP